MAVRRSGFVRARKAAGFTQESFAHALDVDRSTVARWEQGAREPLPYVRAKLARLLKIDMDELDALLNPAAEAVPHPRVTVETSPGSAEGGDDVERKTFLRVLAGSVAGLAFSDPMQEFGARTASVAGRAKIGQADVDHVRQLSRLFAGQDHQYGGKLSSRAVMTQLSASAELTEGSFASARVRSTLFSAVAELADTAAGVCFDAGLHTHAERAFRFGVGCATESGDWAMRAKALSGLVNLSVHQRRTDDALSFAEMALVRADRLSPKVGSMMHTRQARALGLAGVSRSEDCRAAVGKAEDLFAQVTTDTEPEWISYYNAAHLERDAGRALLYVALSGGGHEEARQKLESAVARFPEGHSRGKALAKVNLAILMMACDDPYEAVRLGNDALASVGSVRSDRVNDALEQLADASHTHSQIADVRELEERIRDVVGVRAL
ncbi:helix-turn-helix domain-containing protein [Saccharothrix lopnurensis]|uniref:Multiprotein-bridging factor 1 family protein n=1 Tax=Saccharothrix lopnurensis TaxID=1670621 RepID=A0ABW1PDZ5_9PSEU